MKIKFEKRVAEKEGGGMGEKGQEGKVEVEVMYDFGD